MYIKDLCCRRCFAIAMDIVTENARKGLINEIVFADDLVLISEGMKNLRKKLLKWKETFESKKPKVNHKKPKVMASGLKGEILKSKLTHVPSATSG